MAGCPAWAIGAEECGSVSVSTCQVVDGVNNLLNCCDYYALHEGWCTHYYYTCCDPAPPSHCGFTTGHIHGRAVGSVAVQGTEGCTTICFHVRTGWLTWYQEDDEWQCVWDLGCFVDQYIWKNPGEAPTTYDHTAHYGEPGYVPYPCAYVKFETYIALFYEKCCTVMTY